MEQEIKVTTIYGTTSFQTQLEAKKFIHHEADDGVTEFEVEFVNDEITSSAKVDDYSFDDEGDIVDTWVGCSWITDAVENPYK